MESLEKLITEIKGLDRQDTINIFNQCFYKPYKIVEEVNNKLPNTDKDKTEVFEDDPEYPESPIIKNNRLTIKRILTGNITLIEDVPEDYSIKVEETCVFDLNKLNKNWKMDGLADIMEDQAKLSAFRKNVLQTKLKREEINILELS